MTKGHYHTTRETGEIYLCLKGRGLMMMKLSDGTCSGKSLWRDGWSTFLPTGLIDPSIPATSH